MFTQIASDKNQKSQRKEMLKLCFNTKIIMGITDILKTMFEGLGNNFLIVFLASIIPIGLGILFTFLASKSKIAELIFSYSSLLFECISPIIFLSVLFYIPGMALGIQLFSGSTGRLTCAIIALTICFIGYMPARFVHEYSFLKNVLYNGLGLISDLFKWSFVAKVIAAAELAYSIDMNFLNRGLVQPLIWAFLITSVIIAIFEIAKRLIKQLMK